MVSKQQQLEWLAKKYERWPVVDEYVVMNGYGIGIAGGAHYITKGEWQQERDKMSSKPEVDSSWYEREETPPVGVPVELWFGGVFAYNCEFITMRGNAYVVWNMDDDKPDCADRMNSQFRPLRTEREKAIDEMANLIAKSVFGSAKCQAEKLYDSGYRKVKP